MSARNGRRFMVYADFLGTEQRYAKPQLIVAGRALLEQALARCVGPRLHDDDMHLYVYSDTAIITCPKLGPLLRPIAELFGFFLELQNKTGDDDLRIWLRAAISHGSVLEVAHLQQSERVRTIPLLDTSLPVAYHLESVRKGSRVFVDPKMKDTAFSGYEKYFFKWKQITGLGHPVAGVREFLWPAMRYGSENLAKKTLEFHGGWSRELRRRRPWAKDDYNYGGMLHFDETLKLFIRTCALFCSDSQNRRVMLSILPKSRQERHANIEYEWGVWFQALRGVLVGCKLDSSTRRDLGVAFVRARCVMQSERYFGNFIGELDQPDYTGFKRGLVALGLIQE